MKLFRFIVALAASVLLASVSTASADYVIKSLEIRNSGGTAYGTTMTVSGSGTTLEFRVGIVTGSSEPSTAHRAIMLLPSGFVQQGYVQDSVSCWAGISNVVQANNSFSFDYPAGANCEVVLVAKYRTAGVSTGTAQAYVTLDDSTDGTFYNGNDVVTTTNSLTLNVSSKVSILKALTRDNNGNGYIDRFDVTFNNPYPRVAPGSVAITADTKSATGITLTATAGSYTGTLSFTDGLFTTAETPHIVIGGDANYDSGDYFTQIVEDGAAPRITVFPAGGTFTGSVSVSLSSNESGSLLYTKTGSGTVTYTSPFAINSNSTLSVSTQDIWGNLQTSNYLFTFQCPNSAPSNGSLTAYPGCSVVCNSGYVANWGSCVAIPSSGGGGWGGGGWSITVGGSSGGAGWAGGSVTPIVTDICPAGDRSGSTTDGRCDPLPIGTGSTSTGTTTPTSGGSTDADVVIPWNAGNLVNIGNLSGLSLDLPYFTSLQAAKFYLEARINDPRIRTLITNYYAKLAFSDASYYLSFDADLVKQYNRGVNAYVLYILRTDDVRAKHNVFASRREANQALVKINATVNAISSVDTRYVTSTKSLGKYVTSIYRTKYRPLQRSLSLSERKYLLKFKGLANTRTLDETAYRRAIDVYNSYVLHTTVSTQFKSELATDRAANAKRELDRIFALPLGKPVPSPLPTPTTTPTSPVPQAQTTVGDLYGFTKDLSYGMTDPQVMTLQTILKHYGYFQLNQTTYFGDITRKALVKFSSEKLGIQNPDGKFDAKIRDAMGKLAW